MSRIASDTARVAVQLLQSQLDLAVSLLQNARECREAVLREEEVIEAAREAYRNSMAAVQRLPKMSLIDTERLEVSIEEFRIALKHLVKAEAA